MREKVLPGLHRSSASREPNVSDTLVESRRIRTLTSADSSEARMMSRFEYLEENAGGNFSISRT